MRKSRPPSSTPDTPSTVPHACGPRGGAGTHPLCPVPWAPRRAGPRAAGQHGVPPSEGLRPVPSVHFLALTPHFGS